VDDFDIDKLRRAANRLIPARERADVIETWAGVRPGLSAAGGMPAAIEGDAEPIIAAVAPGVLAATGHHRNGVLMAPATAARVVELLKEGAPPSQGRW
jgi:glycine oxidase